MDYLKYLFCLMAVGMTVLGQLTNYGEQLMPTVILAFFRYGRANKDSNVSFWKNLKLEVPKSWFAHFYLYAVIVQAIICYSLLKIYVSSNHAQVAADSLLAQSLTIVSGEHRSEVVDVTTTVTASVLFLLHLSRRLYECYFVHIYSNTKMNFAHYILAFIHYTGAELSLVSHSIGLTTTPSSIASTSPQWKLCYKYLNIWHVFAISLFIYGSYQQNKAHHQYRQLRLSNSNKTTQSKKEKINYAHRIPVGGLFEKVSCPNYWAEIIIYASFCFLFQLKNYTWNYVFLWVLSNQTVSGVMNHLWYIRTFPDYPKDRKAIIPHVW